MSAILRQVDLGLSISCVDLVIVIRFPREIMVYIKIVCSSDLLPVLSSVVTIYLLGLREELLNAPSLRHVIRGAKEGGTGGRHTA